MDLVISESRPVRSRASTWMAARNRELSLGDQRTPTTRSGCEETRCCTLTQSLRCTETPLPRVTNPVILSPGHRDSVATGHESGDLVAGYRRAALRQPRPDVRGALYRYAGVPR